MTEVFTLTMSFLKELVKRGVTHLFLEIERLDMAISSALASLLMMFVPTI